MLKHRHCLAASYAARQGVFIGWVGLGVLSGIGPALAQEVLRDRENNPAEDPAVAPPKRAAGTDTLQQGGQDSGVAPKWRIVPSLSGGVTFTDNVQPGQGTKRSDTITSVTPKIRISGKGGRVSGDLDLSLQKNIYAHESPRNNDVQKTLSATGKAELIDQWLYVDAGANIARTPISVFATQSLGNELGNPNLAETRSFNFSPYVKGYFGGNTKYELRYRNALTKANSGIYANGSGVNTRSWTGEVSGPTPFSKLGWSLFVDDQRVKFDGRESKTDQVLASLDYQIDPQVKLKFGFGRESDNFSNLVENKRSVHGFGLDWAPSERTLLKLEKNKKSYGDGHTVSFSHRTAQTAWLISDTKKAVIPGQQFTNAPVSTAYDLLFLQLASSIPDPFARAQAVSALLQSAGISANSLIYGDIMASQPFIERSQQASVSLTGVRNTVTLSLQRSKNERIGASLGLTDDFAVSPNIRQSGLSASWAYRLSPESTLTFNALSSRSRGEASLDALFRSSSVLYSTQLGARTTGAVGLRRSAFDGSGAQVQDYIEHAITGTVTATF